MRKAFSEFGEIRDVTRKNKESGIVFAFIEYDSEEGAERAIKAYSLLHLDEILISPLLILSRLIT